MHISLKSARQEEKKQKEEFQKSEDDVKALQSVGQTIGEVLRQLTPESCLFTTFYQWYMSAVIIKVSSGPRYVTGCRSKVDRSKLVPTTRVALDSTVCRLGVRDHT